MTSFAQDLVTVDRERLDLRAGFLGLAVLAVFGLAIALDAAKLFTVLYILVGLGVFAAFIAELTKHRAATIARLRPHDETSHPDAGSVAPGATSPQPTASDEDTPI